MPCITDLPFAPLLLKVDRALLDLYLSTASPVINGFARFLTTHCFYGCTFSSDAALSQDANQAITPLLVDDMCSGEQHEPHGHVPD
eukprot:11940852-Karenia_brevis.AAC.1